MPDPFGDRTEITSAEYRAYVDGDAGAPVTRPAAPGRDVAASHASDVAGVARRVLTDPGVPPRLRERAFQDAVVAYAQLTGWRVHHPFNSRHSPAGFPDLTMVRGDRLIFAELKVGTNTLTRAQVEWIAALDHAGVETFIWYVDDWSAIEEVLA